MPCQSYKQRCDRWTRILKRKSASGQSLEKIGTLATREAPDQNALRSEHQDEQGNRFFFNKEASSLDPSCFSTQETACHFSC